MNPLEGDRVPGGEHVCCAGADVVLLADLVDLGGVDALELVGELIDRQAPALQELEADQLQVIADAARARRRECCCQVPPVDRRI